MFPLVILLTPLCSLDPPLPSPTILAVSLLFRQRDQMGKENKNIKAAMMRGLCHSPSATAVCSHDTLRSVIIPRPRYSRLLQSPPLNRSILLSSTIARTRPPAPHRPINPKQGNSHQLRPLSTSNVFQVVVLRVSLHCQGCAGKVKKHLSKMEGVTSFSIDLETKRVTVMGHITPNHVLESISKVKKAEFWG